MKASVLYQNLNCMPQKSLDINMGGDLRLRLGPGSSSLHLGGQPVYSHPHASEHGEICKMMHKKYCRFIRYAGRYACGSCRHTQFEAVR